MRRLFLFPRFFSLWLILCLALPNTAFALRPPQRESKAGAEEIQLALLDSARTSNVPVTASLASPRIPASPVLPTIAAGAEEKFKDLRGHSGPVIGVVYSFDKTQRSFLTVSSGQVFVRDQDSGSPRFSPIKHNNGILVAAYRSQPRGILVVGNDSATTYESSRGVLVPPEMIFDSPLKLSADGFYPGLLALSPGRTSMLVIKDGADEAVIRNLAPERRQEGRPIQVMAHLRPLQGRPTSVAYRPISPSHRKDGQIAAIGTDGGNVEIWDVRLGREKRIAVLPEHAVGAKILNIAFIPTAGQKVLASADDQGEVRLWYAKGPRFESLRHVSREKIYALAFSPDGKFLASAGESGLIYLWDVETAGLRNIITEKGNSPIYSLAFSPDGKEIAAGRADHTGRIWKVNVNPAAGAEEGLDAQKELPLEFLAGIASFQAEQFSRVILANGSKRTLALEGKDLLPLFTGSAASKLEVIQNRLKEIDVESGRWKMGSHRTPSTEKPSQEILLVYFTSVQSSPAAGVEEPGQESGLFKYVPLEADFILEAGGFLKAPGGVILKVGQKGQEEGTLVVRVQEGKSYLGQEPLTVLILGLTKLVEEGDWYYMPPKDHRGGEIIRSPSGERLILMAVFRGVGGKVFAQELDANGAAIGSQLEFPLSQFDVWEKEGWAVVPPRRTSRPADQAGAEERLKIASSEDGRWGYEELKTLERWVAEKRVVSVRINMRTAGGTSLPMRQDLYPPGGSPWIYRNVKLDAMQGLVTPDRLEPRAIDPIAILAFIKGENAPVRPNEALGLRLYWIKEIVSEVSQSPAAGVEEALGKLREQLGQKAIAEMLPLLIEPGKPVNLETFLPGLRIGELLHAAGYRGQAVMVPLSLLSQAPPQAEPLRVFVQEAKWAGDVRKSLEGAVRQGTIQLVAKEDAAVVVGDAGAGITPRQILLQVNDETARYVTPGLLRYLENNPKNYPPGTIVLINQLIKGDFGEALLLFA